MVAFAVVGIILFGIAAVSLLVKTNQTTVDAGLGAAWDTTEQAVSGPVDAALFRLAKPIGGTELLHSAARNSLFAPLRATIVASGMYGQSLEVFLAYQTAAMLLAASILVTLIVAPASTLVTLGGVLFAVGISGLPYNKVSSTVKEKEEATAESLPEFVDLLQIPIAAGIGVLESLRFTVQYVDSPVSYETRWLLDTLAARTMPEDEAFRVAGQRVGSPEAVAFFTALGQAYVDGTQVAATLSKQADSLRVKAYQARRVKIKRLPISLILTFAMHFLPFLLVLAVLPLIVSLGNLT